jgi:hypothetical protein
MKIYGPYLRKDGRKHLIIIDDNGKRKTISYSKYLLEQKLGRKLLPHETCDHIDGDHINDSLENLQVLSRGDNAAKAMAVRPAEMGYFVCPECHTSFYKSMRDVRGNQLKQRRAGPFCSRQCAGRYGQRLGKAFRGGKPNLRYNVDAPG